jgi:hypothetical protein
VRRLFLIGTLVLAGLIAAPAPGAILARTPGSAEVELRGGAGLAKIRNRGTLIGHVVRGRVVATNNVTVTGWESRRRLSPALVSYRGTDLYFKVYSTQGRWRIRLNGRGVSAGGFVRGCLTLNGVDVGWTGRYRIDSPDFRRWPREATSYKLGAGC